MAITADIARLRAPATQIGLAGAKPRPAIEVSKL
jgi:hypothetical protein